jgi:hypothetical protein
MFAAQGRSRLGWLAATLCLGWLIALPAKAGLTLYFELDHNGGGTNNPYYACFMELNTNSASVNPPNTGYFAWSYSSSINARVNPDGTSSFNGNGFPDYNTLIAEFTNAWTLEVTNTTATNYYTFYGTYFDSNTLPFVAVTFPAAGATDITNQPTFTWTGGTNLGGPYVQVTDGNGFYEQAYLPAGQTNWLCPVGLNYGGYYDFNFDYGSNADATITASTPSNALAQPFPGWVSTCTMYTYNDAWFTVMPAPVLPSQALVEYPMNEPNWSGPAPQVVDATGNGYNGTAVGGANTVADPIFGQVGGFDGNGQYVTVAGPSYSLSGARSIVAWVNPAANNQPLGQPVVVGGSTGAADLFGIAGNGGENSVVQQYQLFVDDWGTPAYYSTATVTPGQWNLVAMTYDGSGTVHFYINGVDAGFGSINPGPYTLYTYDINSYVVGGTGADTGGENTMNGSLNGMMANVGIYPEELTPAQINALYDAALPTNITPAGLTIHFELDHNYNNGGDPYYLLFPELSINANTEGTPGVGYVVSSYTSACTAQVNADGTSSFNGNGFPDYDTLIAEFTNTWTLTVTNLYATNLYTFYGTYFASNTLPLVGITYPVQGATNIPNQPTFTWTGATNPDVLFVQVSADNGFVQSTDLPFTQTNWLCPVPLTDGGTYNFLMWYTTNADTTILATTPLNGLSQPISGWVSTSTLYADDGSTFTVTPGPPPSPIILTGGTLLGNGDFQFSFTNFPYKSFTALGTTNLALPLNEWNELGPVTELSPGRYQFEDTTGANNPCEFYGVSTP